MRKFADVFIAEDVSNIKSYVFSDILVPAAKKLVVDIAMDSLNMFFYGGTKRSDNRLGAASHVSYNRFYDRANDRSYNNTNNSRGFLNYDDLVFENRGEADLVLTRLCEVIETYGVATVGDLYDAVGKTCDYTYEKYGWTNLGTAKVSRVRDGYVLDLPKALPIH